MRIQKNEVIAASKQTGLTEAQAESLWQNLQMTQARKLKSNISTVLLYLGTLITFSSMTWFYVSNLKNSMSLFIALIYALAFFGTGTYFWHKKKMKVPGGLLSCLGIMMIPFIVYALQNLFHWWPMSPSPPSYKDFYFFADGRWIPIGISTLLAACITLYFIRFPFITILIYSALWITSMNILSSIPLDYHSIVSIIIGLFLNILGFNLYRKNRTDFGFWGYFFGMLLCWGGMTSWDIKTEWGYCVYCLINLGLLLISGFFHRKIFLFFGFLGIIVYLSHLAFIFSNTLVFSYILGATGFAIILLAVFLSRSKKERQLQKLI